MTAIHFSHVGDLNIWHERNQHIFQQKKSHRKPKRTYEDLPLTHLVWSCPTHTRSLQMTAVAAEENNIYITIK